MFAHLFPCLHRSRAATPDAEAARRELERVRRQWAEVHEMSAKVSAEKSRNNFGRNIQAALSGRRQP